MMPPLEDRWLDHRVDLTSRPSTRVVMRQTWEHLLFLHWELPAEEVARALPKGLNLEVDTFEGRAFVGLVPFAMRRVRPAGLPSVRGVSNFLETNVRTYVRTPSGRPGVWFFSLDASNPIGVALGRGWFRLPYYLARMSMRARQPEGPQGRWDLAYRSTRIYPGPAASVWAEASTVGPPRASVPGSLEYFLAERYLLYASKGGKLASGRVHHTPYPLQPAEARVVEESAIEASGVRRPDAPPIAHYARKVVVEVFGLEPADAPRPTIDQAN